MFKNFNHKFVYKNPLLWNTTIVPFLLISLVIHVLFFIVGYQNAIVTSVQFHNFYNQEQNATTINLFAVLISVLVFIIWIVLYFRNNAFKAFYPKKNNALFKEWMLILLFCLTTFSYTLSAVLGSNVYTRTLMSQKTALERCKTISQASMFLQGSFKEGNYEYKVVNGQTVSVPKDSFAFEGRKYALKSMMNKNIESFVFFDKKQDSLMRLDVQRFLKENDKEAVFKIFEEYMYIAKEHQLKSNISADKWLDLVYDYPEFTNYKVIGTSERALQHDYDAEDLYNTIEVASNGHKPISDSISTTIKSINGKQYVYSKYYVSQNELRKYYINIASSWQNTLVNLDYILFILYLSFGFSLLVFSFKVTSARSWIIALITLGVVQIIFGIITMFFNFSSAFLLLHVVYAIGVLVYFFMVYFKKRGKRLSGIALNQFLWLLPGFFPAVYVILMDMIKSYSGYYNRYDEETRVMIEEFPKIEWLEENDFMLLSVNLMVLVLVLYAFSGIIKKWRGIPEE